MIVKNDFFIRPLDLDQDFDQVYKLDVYLNGERAPETVFNELKTYAGDIFVGLVKEKIVGFVSISPFFWDKVVMIDHLAVDEKLRRHGIGKALLQYILSEAKRRSARIICVQTALWNWEGIKFYRREGFIPRTTFPNYIGKNNDLIWLDLYLCNE